MKGISLILVMIAMAFVSYLLMEDGQRQDLQQVDNKADQVKQQVMNIEQDYAEKLKKAIE